MTSPTWSQVDFERAEHNRLQFLDRRDNVETDNLFSTPGTARTWNDLDKEDRESSAWVGKQSEMMRNANAQYLDYFNHHGAYHYGDQGIDVNHPAQWPDSVRNHVIDEMAGLGLKQSGAGEVSPLETNASEKTGRVSSRVVIEEPAWAQEPEPPKKSGTKLRRTKSNLDEMSRNLSEINRRSDLAKAHFR